MFNKYTVADKEVDNKLNAVFAKQFAVPALISLLFIRFLDMKQLHTVPVALWHIDQLMAYTPVSGIASLQLVVYDGVQL